MRQYIFGFDEAHPRECAIRLRLDGVDGVVLSHASPDVEEALDREGIELSLCYQAYALPSDADASSLAVDVNGRARRWFGSGCPNDLDNARRRLDAALEHARRTQTARRLIVDGARFASFASPEGADAFFTCFCPRCQADMKRRGFNPDALLHAAKTAGVKDDAEDFVALLRWREAVIQDYFAAFADAVHALPGSVKAGAFVFAPSLAGFVGQTARTWRNIDWVAPMLYRAWTEPEGPACLNHEHANAARMLGDALGAIALASGIPHAKDCRDADAILREGFSPERVAQEVAWAREFLNGAPAELAPILQIRDNDRNRSAELARRAGADQIGWFAYALASS